MFKLWKGLVLNSNIEPQKAKCNATIDPQIKPKIINLRNTTAELNPSSLALFTILLEMIKLVNETNRISKSYKNQVGIDLPPDQISPLESQSS